MEVKIVRTEYNELAQRVQELVDEYNEVVRLLNGKDKRKDKNSKPTLGEVLDVRSRCYKLEVENRELKRFAKAMHTFVKDKNIYMRKGIYCEHKQGNPQVCSTACLECSSCLGVIEGHGVICEKRLAEACAVFPSFLLTTNDANHVRTTKIFQSTFVVEKVRGHDVDKPKILIEHD